MREPHPPTSDSSSPSPDAGQSGIGGVAVLLRARRRELGLTLAEVAQRAGMARSYLSMIENQRVAHPPSARRLEALAQALELDPHRLRRAADWEQTPPSVRAALTQARQAAAVSLDQLIQSGQLQRGVGSRGPGVRDQGSEGSEHSHGPDEAGGAPQSPIEHSTFPIHHFTRTVPLINKVAAGLPSEFTDLDYPAQIADDYVPAPHLDADPDAFAATVTGDSMLPEYRPGDIVIFSSIADVTDGCDCFARLEPDHETTFKRVYLTTDEAGREMIRLQPLNPRYEARIIPREQVAGLFRAVWKMARV